MWVNYFEFKINKQFIATFWFQCDVKNMLASIIFETEDDCIAFAKYVQNETNISNALFEINLIPYRTETIVHRNSFEQIVADTNATGIRNSLTGFSVYETRRNNNDDVIAIISSEQLYIHPNGVETKLFHKGNSDDHLNMLQTTSEKAIHYIHSAKKLNHLEINNIELCQLLWVGRRLTSQSQMSSYYFYFCCFQW